MSDHDAEDCCGPNVEHDVPSVHSKAGELELAALAKALGHPARVRIMRLLLARESCVCGELVAELPLAQATVSQHLKVLRECGLVRGEIDGPRVCYCVDRSRLADVLALVGELCAASPTEISHPQQEAMA